MAKRDPILEAIRLIFPKKSSLAILSYGYLNKSDTLAVTDLDRRLEIHCLPTSLKSGLYYLPMLIASKGDYGAAHDAAEGRDIEDFPGGKWIEKDDRNYVVPVDVLAEPEARAVGGAVTQEINRTSLQHIHFNADEHLAEATDGHILFRQMLQTPFRTSFSIKPVDLQIIHTLIQTDMPYKAVIYERWSKPTDKKVKPEVTHRYLQVTASKYTFITRIDPGSYPDVPKVIPKHPKENAVVWTEGQTHLTRHALESFLPFVEHGRRCMGLIGFDEHNFFSVNTSTGVAKRWTYPVDSVCKLPVVDVMGTVEGVRGKVGERQLPFKCANVECFIEILRFIDGAVVFNAGSSQIDGMTFRNNTSGRMALLMPLRGDEVEEQAKGVKFTELQIIP